MKIFYRRIIQNIAILMLMFFAIKDFIISLPLRYSSHFAGIYKRIDSTDTMFMKGRLAFIISVIMILLAYNLYKRLRNAWIGEVILLTVSIVMQVFTYHVFALQMVIIESIVLVVLIVSFPDFTRMPSKGTLKKSVVYILLALFLMFLNASVGIYLVRGDMDELNTLGTAFYKSIELLFFMDKSVLSSSGRIAVIYANSLITLYWGCILGAILILLKPLTIKHFKYKNEKEIVHQLALKYGQNPMSYLTIEDDKTYYFSKQVEGVVAYTVVGNVMLICGDMLCRKEDGLLFLADLLTFSKSNYYDLVFLNVTDYFMDLYGMAQFGILKYGEDACFKLDEYNLKGGGVAKVRAAINHATKAGITVYEYKAKSNYDALIEEQIQGISLEWLKSKNMPEMQFMLGSIGLVEPRERRYFYAMDSQGIMLGFVVFLPYLMGDAYLAEVTRRRNNAPQGVLEKIIYEAFMTFKEEGVIYGNMGLSPLYNTSSDHANSVSEKISHYIYENLNAAYDFKALHHAKEKYAPTHWESRYLVYYPKPMTLKYAYAIVKAQNPEKLSTIMLSQFKEMSLLKKGVHKENGGKE